MPNTAQVNQPLIQHPLPWAAHRILGAGSKLVKGALPSTDTLLVSAPASSPNGSVVRAIDVFSAVPLMNNVGPGIEPGADNFSLVYIDPANNECILTLFTNDLPQGGTVNMQAPNLLLGVGDGSVYLRLGALQEAGPVPFTGSLDCYFGFTDTRDIVEAKLDLTDVFQTILSGAQGKTRLLTPFAGEFAGPFATALNFDSVDHTVEALLSDGNNTIPIASVSQNPVTAGRAATVEFGDVGPFLLEGWMLQLRVQEAIDTKPCRIVLGYTDTNLSPVRGDQGGAY